MNEELKNYKWLISSCLQKSIRRGRNDLAQNYLNFLWEHDRSYVTYRFGTILSEDIGVANHNLVNEYLGTKLAKKKIDELGGLDFLSSLTKQACESAKDRSSCDSAYLAAFFNFNVDTKEQATNIFKDFNASYIDRINAGWAVLGGKKFKSENIKFLNLDKTQDDLDSYIDIVTQITNPFVANIVKNSYSTQVENIGLGTPIIESIYQKELTENNHKIEVGKIIEHFYVKEETFYHKETGLDLISCGMDGHTREGKSVYYNYLKNHKQFTHYLNSFGIDYEQHIDIFKHCMFRVEGHEVNKRIYFPTAVTVMRECEQKVLNFKAGLPENTLNFKTIRSIILEDIGIINQMKSDSLSTPATNFYKKKF